MTLKELKQRCEKVGIKYAYGLFKKPTSPPFLIARISTTDNIMADNKVYCKHTPIRLDHIYEHKDLDEQDKIENEILKDVVWNKTEETYLQSERIWQVSYFFEI